jgi:hypothetical protein
MKKSTFLVARMKSFAHVSQKTRQLRSFPLPVMFPSIADDLLEGCIEIFLNNHERLTSSDLFLAFIDKEID